MFARPEVALSLLAKAVDQSFDGIVIADARQPDQPVIYVNRGFEMMTGYLASEVVGRNCRFLQGQDSDQTALAVVREAIKKGENCIVILRNFRKDGSLFWNEFSLSPVRDEAGVVMHFIGVIKDVTARTDMLKHLRQSKVELQEANRQLSILALTDGLTGISNRRHFDEQSLALLSMAQRSKVSLAVLMIDLDNFKQYNDYYGHAAGDACLIAVSKVITELFQRPGDCAARYGGEEFGVVSLGVNLDEMQLHAQQLREKVMALEIPHIKSDHARITVSIGVVARTPKRESSISMLLKKADEALYQAKERGRNCVVAVPMDSC